MTQPPLPENKPYVNRNLFSEHFLRELLPQDESWHVDEDNVSLAMQAALNLYAPRRDDLPMLNEAQLEREFVHPLLEALDHSFEVQPSLPTSEGVRRPDYAFFAAPEDKVAARKRKGKLEYFKKAICLGDAKHWGRPLDKRQRVGTDKFDMLSPSWQIDYYLRISEVPWGVLTDGRFWRLYNHDTSFRLDVFYEIDLPQLLAQRDIQAFKYFYLFFRRQAFIRDAEGLCFLDRVFQGSLEYARTVGDDLKESVYKALRLLAEGFVETRGNKLDPQRDLAAIHENSLVYLYRLLFINYAEDRRLLPRDMALYRETYGLVSMEGEIASKLERQESLSPLQATCWEKLSALFDLINRGSEAFGIDEDTLYVPPYNGGLFDPERHPFLEQYKVGDRWLAQVIDLLARSKGEEVRRAFVDYSSLDVRHLGSIYEGLLEYKLRVAEEEMVAIKRRGREQWMPAKEAESKKVVERVRAGGLYLATDRGERKATGSYYTPDYIVKYIVENTVGPLIEEKMKAEDPIEGILSLKVLDPAMGSGHFLVEATDRLAHALVEALGGSEEASEGEDIRWARREVVERCIYGVDLNPLAVELAKLSLWLHTVAEGKPLNFLDHHLKVGNSVVGAWVDDLGSLPVPAKKAKAREAEVHTRQMNLFEIRLDEQLPVMLGKVLEIIRRGSETLEDIKAKTAADQAVRQLKAPFKAVADLWASTYFGNDVAEAMYQEALEYIGEPGRLVALPVVERAKKIAEKKRFFHWELEFPEVFYENANRRQNPGFDAVVGNPPYINANELNKVLSKYEKPYWKARFQSASGAYDLYILFLELSASLAAKGRFSSLITPNKFLSAPYAMALREYIVATKQLLRLFNLSRARVFEDPAIYPVVSVIRNVMAEGEYPIIVEQPGVQNDLSDLDVSPHSSSNLEKLPDMIWGFLISELLSLILKATKVSDQLQQISNVRASSTTSEADTYGAALLEIAGRNSKRFINTGLIDRYSTLWGIEPTTDKGTTLLTPNLDLDSNLISPARADQYAKPKIIFAKIALRIEAFLDKHGEYASTNTNFVYDSEYDLRYLTAVLNSGFLSALYAAYFGALIMGGGYFQFQAPQLRILPIRRISFTTPADVRQQLIAQAQTLYATGDQAALLTFTDARLAVEPEQSDVIHDVLAYLAQQMIEMNRNKQAEVKGFLDWLTGYTGLPIEEWRLKTRAKAYWEHGCDELRRALHKNRKAIQEASGLNVVGRKAMDDIQGEFEQSVTRLRPLLERIASTDRLIDLIVYRLYGLTEEEVAVVEESVTRRRN